MIKKIMEWLKRKAENKEGNDLLKGWEKKNK